MTDTTGNMPTACDGCNAHGYLSDDGTVVKFECGSYIGTHDEAITQRSRECLVRGERFHADVATRQAGEILDLHESLVSMLRYADRYRVGDPSINYEVWRCEYEQACRLTGERP